METVNGGTIHCYPESMITGNEWKRWRMRIWNQMAVGLGGYPGLAPLEQWMRRSHKERRCVECGDPGEAEQESVLVLSVRSYWLCADCAMRHSCARHEGGSWKP